MVSDSAPLRVVLADDHRLMRAGLRALLEDMGGVEVVAEAADGEEALAHIQRHRPDVAILDLAMPKLSGISVTEQVTVQVPETRILLLSMHSNAICVTNALRAGAAGYLVKDAAVSELEIALQSVREGSSYLSPAACGAVVQTSLRSGGRIRVEPRQTEVLRGIVEGRTTKEIAFSLAISPKTVEVHRAQVMERLQIFDVPGLVRYAMRIGLIGTEPSAGSGL